MHTYNVSPITSILDAWTSMILPAQLAVMFFVATLMLASVMFASYLDRQATPKPTKHRRSMIPTRSDSNKEDFFDMVTRFREEIDA